MRSVLYCTAYALLLWCVTCLASAEETRGDSPLFSVMIGGEGEPPLVPVQVFGKWYLFLVDTGTSHTLLDVAFRRDFDVEPVTNGGNVPEILAFPPSEISVKGVSFELAKGTFCIDLAFLSECIPSPVPIAGILGCDFLKTGVVEINNDAHTLTFWNRGTARTLPNASQLPLRFRETGTPLVSANVGTGELWCLMDTGSFSSGNCPDKDLESLIEARLAAVKRPITIVNALGRRDTIKAHVDRLRLGRFDHRNIILSKGEPALLGWYFWVRYNVMLDLEGASLIVQPARGWSAADRTDRWGIACDGDLLNITSVAEKSPAEKAGLMAGDRLHRIGASERVSMNKGYVLHHLSRPNMELNIEVIRNGEHRTFTLRD